MFFVPSYHIKGNTARIALVVGGLAAAPVAASAPHRAMAQELAQAIDKVNLYIEVAKGTERAVDSWERYASWVNMQTGPTGRERYISYGLHDLPDLSGLIREAREAVRRHPSVPQIDAVMVRYLAAYEALAPVINRAADYYDRKAYQKDKAAAGRTLHKELLPRARTFLAEREAMLVALRPVIRDVERQELLDLEAREGRMRSWQVAQAVHAAHRVLDVFPRIRPTPIDSDTFDKMLRDIGPSSPGEKFDELIAGVARPKGTQIDVKMFEAALTQYAEAVQTFDAFADANPEGLKDFRKLPRQLLGLLQALREPLTRSQGRDFDGAGRMVGRIVEVYFSMVSESSSVSRSRLRFLP
jgi:hypothetical protein